MSKRKLKHITPVTSKTADIVGSLFKSRKLSKDGKDTGAISDEAKLHATFSDLAYKPSIIARNKKKEEHLGKELSSEWKEDSSFTSPHQKVYVNKKDKRVITAYRGTFHGDLSNDLATDAAIVVGFEHKTGRFKKASKNFEDIALKYKDYDHNVTGHSLGGAIAKHVLNEHTDLIENAHIFNPGAGLGSLFKEENSKVIGHYMAGDVISMLGMDAGHEVNVYKGEGSAHSLENFL